MSEEALIANLLPVSDIYEIIQGVEEERHANHKGSEQEPTQERQDESEFEHPIIMARSASAALLELIRFYVSQGRPKEGD